MGRLPLATASWSCTPRRSELIKVWACLLPRRSARSGGLWSASRARWCCWNSWWNGSSSASAPTSCAALRGRRWRAALSSSSWRSSRWAGAGCWGGGGGGWVEAGPWWLWAGPRNGAALFSRLSLAFVSRGPAAVAMVRAGGGGAQGSGQGADGRSHCRQQAPGAAQGRAPPGRGGGGAAHRRIHPPQGRARAGTRCRRGLHGSLGTSGSAHAS